MMSDETNTRPDNPGPSLEEADMWIDWASRAETATEPSSPAPATPLPPAVAAADRMDQNARRVAADALRARLRQAVKSAADDVQPPPATSPEH